MKGLHLVNITLKVPGLILAVSILIVNGVFFLANAQEMNHVSDYDSKLAKYKDAFERLQPVRVYGRVVDLKGSPIGDAEVEVAWEQATFWIGKPKSGGRDLVKSDTNGCWEFVISKPDRAYVRDVKKQGYEYTTLYNKESSVRDLIYQPTTQDDPMKIVLRKIGETIFLIHRDGSRPIQAVYPHSQTNNLDLLAETPDKWKNGSYADIQVAIDYNRTRGSWTVTFSATNGTDGLLISTNLLYEAPLDGYQKEVCLYGHPWPPYLFLRSRSPAIYSRIDLEYFPWKGSDTNQVFRIRYKAWINPYGERNLEYESNLEGQWQLRKQLESEAKADLLKNKRPVKPDLPKLIKEAKEKADKGKP
jgi:hypothetical protein